LRHFSAKYVCFLRRNILCLKRIKINTLEYFQKSNLDAFYKQVLIACNSEFSFFKENHCPKVASQYNMGDTMLFW